VGFCSERPKGGGGRDGERRGKGPVEDCHEDLEAATEDGREDVDEEELPGVAVFFCKVQGDGDGLAQEGELVREGKGGEEVCPKHVSFFLVFWIIRGPRSR
jgi:hypothetical protein